MGKEGSQQINQSTKSARLDHRFEGKVIISSSWSYST
jgi:hypothetical protein